MPRYTFVCDACVIEFDRTLKIAENLTHECPSCTGMANRVWDASGLSFGFADSPNAAPANSGVHKEDYPTADHLIGKDANLRWGEISEREKVKNAAREKGGTHALIRHTDPQHIDYEPMSGQGMAARRSLARAAIEGLRAQKPSK
jgi:putative FmdB family regulatory protein